MKLHFTFACACLVASMPLTNFVIFTGGASTTTARAAAAERSPALAHRPVEFRYDAFRHKMRDPATNAAITSAFSGYQSDQGFYTQASQQWTVPTVTYGPSTSTATQYSSFWVGIQGDSSTLVQLGTEQEVSSSGGTNYYAWYELYPSPGVQIPKSVRPGDLVSASVTCNSPCTANTAQSWTLFMQDSTQGWTWSQTFSFNNGNSNYAEWIMEAPHANGNEAPLADYVKATFASVGLNGVIPSLSSSNALTMQNPYGQTSLAAAYQSDGFVTCWGYGSTPTCGSSVAAPPTVSLVSSATSIQVGQSVTLTWGSTNATNCTGTGFSTGGAISGSVAVVPASTATYSTACSDSGGTARASVTVSVASASTRGGSSGGGGSCTHRKHCT